MRDDNQRVRCAVKVRQCATYCFSGQPRYGCTVSRRDVVHTAFLRTWQWLCGIPNLYSQLPFVSCQWFAACRSSNIQLPWIDDVQGTYTDRMFAISGQCRCIRAHCVNRIFLCMYRSKCDCRRHRHRECDCQCAPTGRYRETHKAFIHHIVMSKKGAA